MTAANGSTSMSGRADRPDHTDRFRPTRCGIINLWDYRDEEFVFADGRMVLRGPNGSGKTKALEVLFPFVFDGRIEPRRLNPFAGEERTMKSNLLYRGQESAHAYVWMEFRRDPQPGTGSTEIAGDAADTGAADIGTANIGTANISRRTSAGRTSVRWSPSEPGCGLNGRPNG